MPDSTVPTPPKERAEIAVQYLRDTLAPGLADIKADAPSEFSAVFSELVQATLIAAALQYDVSEADSAVWRSEAFRRVIIAFSYTNDKLEKKAGKP